MKKILMFGLALLLLAGAAPLFAQPTDLEIEEAFSLSFQVFFLASMQSAFGFVVPGVELDEEGMTLTDVDLVGEELTDGSSYTTLSGRITAREGNDMVADLLFAGGAVRKMTWEVPEFDPEENFVVYITADGKDLTLDSSRFDAE